MHKATPLTDLRLTLLDAGRRVLASGPAVTLALAAGQTYYVNVADPAGGCGGYDLSLAKPATGGGGGKKGFLQAHQLAGDGLYPDESSEGPGHDRAEHGLSRAWSALAGPERPSASARSLVVERDGFADA